MPYRSLIMEDNIETRANLEICPNCLEENREDLAVCKYCGMPLRADGDVEMPTEEEIAEIRSAEEQAPAEPQPEEKKEEKKNGFRYAMRYLGLYVIVTAIFQLIDVFKNETDPSQIKLGILANVIYIIAGVMMAYPILGDWLKKRKEAKDGSQSKDQTH